MFWYNFKTKPNLIIVLRTILLSRQISKYLNFFKTPIPCRSIVPTKLTMPLQNTTRKKMAFHNPNADLSKKVIHFYNIRWEAFLRIMTGEQQNKSKLIYNAWRIKPQFDDSDRPDFGSAGITSAKKNFSPYVQNYHADDWAKCFAYFAYYVTAKKSYWSKSDSLLSADNNITQRIFNLINVGPQ